MTNSKLQTANDKLKHCRGEGGQGDPAPTDPKQSVIARSPEQRDGRRSNLAPRGPSVAPEDEKYPILSVDRLGLFQLGLFRFRFS